jgi:hypothetical protein
LKRIVGAVVAAGIAAFGASAVLAAHSGATGTFCGAGSRCTAIPLTLAVTLSQRNDAFHDVPAPRATSYYRIKITASGEGYINRTIIWVPSAKAWYLKEYVTPPLPGYWRNANPAATPGLLKLARKVRPFAPPRHWILPH